MSYDTVESSEHSAKQTYLYRFVGPDFELNYTNAQKTITATISGVAYDFRHPVGGIRHTEPTESQDPARTATRATVSMINPLYRKHREYPPHGDTTLSIYRQNEVGGTPRAIWNGTVWGLRVDDSRAEVELECKTDFELMALSEGLSDTFQHLCNWFLYSFPCPVNKANWRVAVSVEEIDTDNFTVTVSGAADKLADWFKNGFFEAPNGDKRFVIADEVSGSNHVLTLQQNFPSTTLKAGYAAEAYPGCDRAFATGRDKFGSETGQGVACGTNHIQANQNPHEVGRLV